MCSRDALHDDFPSSFFIAPKWCFIVLAFRVCIPLLLGKYKYPALWTKTSDRPSTTFSEPSPHPSISGAPVLHGAPQALLTTPQPLLWHNAVVAFRAFMLAVVWGRLKTHCVRQALSWVAGGWRVGGPAGLRVERQECAYEWANVCWAPADRGTVCPCESCSSTSLFNYTCCSSTVLKRRS